MAVEPDRPQPESGVPQPPRLEFKPDSARTSRIRTFRIVILGLAAAVLVACLVWLISFRPRFSVPTIVREPQPATGSEPVQPPAQVAAAPTSPGSQSGGVREEVDRLETLLQDMRERWRRAASCVPLAAPAQGQSEDAVVRVRRAVVMAESAAVLADSGREHLAGLKESLRRAGAGGYRASELSAAADEFARELRRCAADRLEHFRAQELAYAALAAGDSAEFEIKGDVATGYLRKSELGERRVERARERMRVALGELER